MNDGYETQASVAFFNLRSVGEQNARSAFAAIFHLHRILEDLVANSDAIRVTSALHGAIVVVPEEVEHNHSFDLREALPGVVRGLTECQLPVRIGVAHGRVEYLQDADDNGNFIGPVVNTAARLAYANENKGLLFHESFQAARAGYVTAKNDAIRIGPGEQLIRGKSHDEPFRCFPAEPPIVMTGAFARDLTFAADDCRNVDGVAVAFDLPTFSSGARVQMGHRFRAFVAQVRKVQSGSSDDVFYYSPGGDGGIFVFTGRAATTRAVQAAKDIDQHLEIEGTEHSTATSLRCRIGVHYGSVALYRNAEGVWRPTGRVLFVADRLGSDQKPGVYVYSKQLEDAVSRGSASAFERDYRWLEPLDCPPDGSIERFVAAAQFTASRHSGQEGFEATFDQVLADLQAIVDAGGSGVQSALLTALYSEQASPRPEAIDVCYEIRRLGSGTLLLRVVEWLRRQKTCAFNTDNLRDFCGGVSVFSVDPAWAAKGRETNAGTPLRIPDAETELPANKANLYFLLLLALRNTLSLDGHGFDLERLLGDHRGAKHQVSFGSVAARGVVGPDVEDEIKRIVVLSVYRETPVADLKNRSVLHRHFEKSCAEMASRKELGNPYVITYPGSENEKAFLANLRNVGLWRSELGYLLSEVAGLDGVVHDIIRVVNCLHEIRSEIARLAKLAPRTS